MRKKQVGPFFSWALCGVSLKCFCQLLWVQSTFSVAFTESLFGAVDTSRSVVEGVDRLLWETRLQFSPSTAQQELGFSHLHFDISLFKLCWGNHSLSLLRIPQVVKRNYCKRVVMNILLKHTGISKARFMFVTH